MEVGVKDALELSGKGRNTSKLSMLKIRDRSFEINGNRCFAHSVKVAKFQVVLSYT